MCRAGFDFALELAWSAALGSEQATASGALKYASPLSYLYSPAYLQLCIVSEACGCRLPGISPDDIDDLGDMLEVSVKERGEGCGSEADVVRLVKGLEAQLQAKMQELQRMLREK